MDISKEMVNYRARHRLSQEKMAELLGVVPMTISCIENGKNNTRKTTVSRFEQLLAEEVK